MNSIKTASAFVEALFKQQLGVSINFRELYGADFFPHYEESKRNEEASCSICINHNMEVLMNLYNRVLVDKEAKGRAIIHYMLFYVYIESETYDSAEEHLRAFQKELSSWQLDELEDEKERLVVQVLFIILHEAYHILFHLKPEIKEQCLDEEIRRQKDIQGEWEYLWQSAKAEGRGFILNEARRNASILIPQELPSDMKTEMMDEVLKEVVKNVIKPNDYDDLVNGDAPVLLEELACDRLAWVYLMEHFKTQGIEENELLQMHYWAYIALNALDLDKAYNSWYRPIIHEKTQFDIKGVLLRHKSFRSLVRHYIVSGEAKLSLEYKQITKQVEEMFNEMSENLYKNREELISLYQPRDDESEIGYDREKLLKSEMDKIAKPLLGA